MTDDGTALLAAIRANPLERTPQLLYRDWAEENPDAIRRLIASARRAEPLLTADGIGVPWQKGESPEARDERFERERAALDDYHAALAASMAWLATRGRLRAIDRGRDSYGYKHDVERYWQGTEHSVYVPNGALVAAVICSGFVWRHADGCYVFVGISRKEPKG